ncbi:vesicular glutamate transporter 2-like isoform X2 [Schistocerca cancellata]|uniref:vesicular glutamate transporter 2-like isoform X2 n=1 Tax=Schistocerca cancellata TaxID=274614 RepID=UPI0021186088|nr:vesicular glutamate transporter 2-like isoform X2 [Schistocerca cancellata]
MARKEHQPDPEKHRVPVLGVRHLQALLLCIAHVLVFSLRTNMSVAVVVMANNTAGNPNIKDYGWSQSETSTILSSFFWGYVVMQAPAGWAADRFNSKNLFSASLILSGILTMLTEVAADTGGVVLVCAFRVVMGLAQKFPTPWISIFTSLPVFASIVATLSLCWGYYTLLTEIPTYMSNVLGFDIASNGLLSALPYVVNCALSLAFSWIINGVEKKEIFSKGTLRKVANSIGYWIPAAALVALSFIPVDDPTAAVILLTVSVGFNSISIMGYQMNLIDIAPNFSGLMMGITGSIGTLMSVAAPLYVGAIVKENTIQEWRIVFLTAAAVFFVGNLIFVIFGDGEVQPWNDPNYSRGKKTETIEKVAV